MKNLVVIGAVILSLTGCYKFKTPPFAEKDLTPVSESQFGKKVLKALSEINVNKNSPIAGMKDNLSGDSKALVINDEFLVIQNNKKGSWELTMMMKNSSHIFACVLGENKDIQIPQSLKVTEKKEMMGVERNVSGPSEELKQFALKLVNTSQKMCLGIPFKSSNTETTTKPWWKVW
jgi:hypothetical protein